MKLSIQKLLLIISVLNIGIAIAGFSPKPGGDGTVDAHEYPNFAKFLAKHRCPEYGTQNPEGWSPIHGGDRERDWNYVVKGGDITRIINAERMREVIKTHELNRIDVPKKCLDWNKYSGDHGGWHVLAEKVKDNPKKAPVTLSEFKQIEKLVEETRFTDLSAANILRDTTTDKFVFIDTENRSFVFHKEGDYHHGQSDDNLHKKDFPVPSLLSYCMRHMFRPYKELKSPETLDYRNQNTTFYSVDQPKALNPLPNNTEYDPPDIDYEKVKKEFYAYNKAHGVEGCEPAELPWR